MNIQRTSQELLTTYARLKHTAETLDQSELDTNKAEDYVNISFNQVQPKEGEWGLHGTRQINSHPATYTNSVSDGLIGRTTEVKKFNISEVQFGETVDAGRVRHGLEFEDDGRVLRVKESVVSYNDDETFLDTQEQSYLIYHKSGKMRTLEPKKIEVNL